MVLFCVHVNDNYTYLDCINMVLCVQIYFLEKLINYNRLCSEGSNMYLSDRCPAFVYTTLCITGHVPLYTSQHHMHCVLFSYLLFCWYCIDVQSWHGVKTKN